MDIKLIKAPGRGTVEILRKRSGVPWNEEKPGAIGLIQGKIIEMICASDIAEKATDVVVTDIRGSCPQNMVMLAVIGDLASVEESLIQIRRASEGR